jgi:hypothetical protein
MFKGLFTPSSSPPKPRLDSMSTISSLGRSPSSSIDETQEISDLILESARVIPPRFIDGIRAELIKVLAKIEPRRYPELIQRAGTVCVSEYLTDVFTLLTSQMQSAEKNKFEFKEGKERNKFIADTEEQKKIYFVSIAELLGEGFEVALKPNLEFDASGNPTGIREKDRTRFPRCHAYLQGRMGGKSRTTRKRKVKKSTRRKKVRHSTRYAS